MERALDCIPKMMNEPKFKESWDSIEEEYSIAAALIEARTKSGMTQSEISNKTGVSQPVIARLESGRNIYMKTLKRYASTIGQPISFTITQNKLVVL